MPYALIGGEEFADGFETTHEALIAPIAGGRSRGVFLPTCASHDGYDIVLTWCDRAQLRLSPYAAQVSAPTLMDKADAHNPANVALLDQADWIYLGGGYPHVGLFILSGTPVMSALRRAAQRGALILGASAGAMMICQQTFVISPGVLQGQTRPEPIDGTGFIPRCICLPHYNQPYIRPWEKSGILPEGLIILGVDEQTALVNRGAGWEVLGRGRVVIQHDGRTDSYHAGHPVTALEDIRV